MSERVKGSTLEYCFSVSYNNIPAGLMLSRQLMLFLRRPNSGEAGKKPSRPSSGGQEKPANDKKKDSDARERRRKEMMQNQVC